MPNRVANSMEKAITMLHRIFPTGEFKTETTDRGQEFDCWKAVQEKLGMSFLGRYILCVATWK